jgi:nucleoside 2-deoxyribosyltransferase
MPDWMDNLDEDGREQWDEFVKHVREETVRGMTDSALVMSLVPPAGKADVKFAVELGFSIMLDKPIIAVMLPGAEIPAKLRLVADEIVTADIDTEQGQNEVQAALMRMTTRLNKVDVRNKKKKR